MSVQNVECQIAQAQIGRYLTGGALSPEALEQLEGHIGECAACTEMLRQRREGLQAMLGGQAAVEADPARRPTRPEPHPAPTASLVGRLREQLIQAATAPAPDREGAPDRRSFLRPLALSGALAVVLVAMTVLSRNPNLVFGEKAAPPAKETAPAKAPAVAQPAATAPKPVASTPATTPVVEPATSAPKPAPPAAAKSNPPRNRPTPHPAAPAKKPDTTPPPQPKHGSIRVYDANGNPINPRSTP